MYLIICSILTAFCHKHLVDDLPFSGCSYYAASFMAYDAQLVFCPYSYIINPIVRGAMDVDIKGAIVILDEAQYISKLSVMCFRACREIINLALSH